MVSIGSGQSLEGGFHLPDQLATKAPGLHGGGSLDAPEVLAGKARHENFPVASRLLPRKARSALMAIYGFARLTDDLGDEAQGDRLALLDWLEAEVQRAGTGTASHPVLQSLTPVIRDFQVSLDPFLALIEANRMDQRVSRYQSFDDLVGYCMLSAAPVGRLVLSVFRVSTPQRIALSDEVCIGLQLVEHLQDIGEDARRGRVYMPGDDMARFSCTEGDLLAPSGSRALRDLVGFEVARARELVSAAVPLAASLELRPRAAVVGFGAGGLAALDSIERAGNDVLKVRCRPNKLRFGVRGLSGLAAASLKRGRS